MTQVLTQQGYVEGETRGNHCVFRGIPFAAPPVGRLRFRAPEPPEPWAGVRSARGFGPSSIQPPPALETAGLPEPISEDCLYLNVYTPAADGARRPVFFWIHGGSFKTGAGGEFLYDGGALAERGDIVVVTINYRLGALGFSHWSEAERARLGTTCNAGNLDQLAALRWVRENIAAFGGDPNAVTLAGESAGAYSVAVLSCMPAARGLFVRAITQSGARLARGNADPAQNSRELRRVLEIPETRLEALWELPARQILAAQQLIAARSSGPVSGLAPFTPVPDGDTLPWPLDQALARGECANVPLLIGTNRDEMNLFLGPALKKLHEPISEAALLSQLQALVPAASEDRLRALFELYRRTRRARKLPDSERALLAAISGDGLFRIPSMRFAEAYLARQPATFQYLFTYESPAMRGALRSCHALELPFMFGTLDKPGQPQFAGSGEAQQRLSARMMDSWIAFTRTGDPSVPGPNQAWPAYDVVRRPTMVFDLQSGLEYAPYEDERAAWDDLTPRPLA
jgi:para-nitrobenzyl esterase